MSIVAPIANTFGLGNNAPPPVNMQQPTPIDSNLTFSNIWPSSYDNLPFAGAVQSLQANAPSPYYESLAFFLLTFGQFGAFTSAGINGIQSAQNSGTS
jgi:hypothetical protein